ncbi:hypothetical protein RAAC3_TM7C00001G0210 [Candidatus Saccharibacteria bacterium RAAC3_TM7_1]|nr:hypothetical protein RAAC3_TM7C00001G0210 [Candidatus Saccharibacteria bacterium RAAC3_TM7_1]HCZ28752.1 hypothetical protein [Candidatus Saccharibacteria bacterium]
MKQKLFSFFDTLSKFAGSKTARRIVLGAFVVQALLLAFVTHVGTPPDENNHLNFIRHYADHSLSPIFEEQTPTRSLGDKTREVDYLYHYGASFIARALPGEKIEVYVIRVISVLAALLTMIMLVRLLRRLGVSAATTTVTLAIITNLPMVLMVSAEVNNDVFVWLGYVLSLLLVLRIWRRPTVLDTLLLLNIIVAGGLIKRTLLPLGLVLVFVVALLVYRKWALFVKSSKRVDWRVIAAGVFLVIVSGLFIERVGGNLYRYGAVAPTCEQVQGEKACEVFWASSRKKWLDAGAPTDKGSWLGSGVTRDETPLPLPVFTAKWLTHSVTNIADIQTQGWRHEATPPTWLAPGLLLVMIGAIGYGIVRDTNQWRKTKQDESMLRLFATGTALFVMGAHLSVNYSEYLTYQVFGLALNGRYILPALLVLIGLSCYYLAKLLPRRVSQILAVVTIILIVGFTGIAMMLRNSQLITG